jgi:type I restriction enzyme S subunit
MNQGCRSLVFRGDNHRNFFYFQVRAARPVLEAIGRGSTFQELAKDDLESVALCVPPWEEQHAIASFLDRETGKIDALVARKERLIELLQEKRTALITHAVTRGLDPSVCTKDSGVKWLGAIPSHWGVRRLKYLVPALTVGIVVTPAKYYVDEGVPCLRSLNVSRGEIDMENLVFISEQANELHRKSKIFEGDVVVVRTGQAGTAAVIPYELDGANCIDLLIIRRSEQIRSKLIYYYLNSSAAISQAGVEAVGAIQAHYNTSTLATLLVPTAPLDEQDAIVKHLDEQTRAIDRLAERIREGSDRLREFRTALVSAAVTGKIDVREEAP